MLDKCDCVVEFERYIIYLGFRVIDGDDVCFLVVKDGFVVIIGVVMDIVVGVDLFCGVFVKKVFLFFFWFIKE